MGEAELEVAELADVVDEVLGVVDLGSFGVGECLVAELFEQDADPLSDEFQQARKQLEGLEQYLLQLWRES